MFVSPCLIWVSVCVHRYSLLAHCQRKVGSWVGSSVIHLGDHNVPNGERFVLVIILVVEADRVFVFVFVFAALMFIDKYNQVARILNPVVLVLNELPALVSAEQFKFANPPSCG